MQKSFLRTLQKTLRRQLIVGSNRRNADRAKDSDHLRIFPIDPNSFNTYIDTAHIVTQVPHKRCQSLLTPVSELKH